MRFSIALIRLKLIFNRINDYLEKSHLISDKQFGFRQNFSTSHAISNIYEKLTQNSDKGMYSCCIFFDLTKAFDTVNHDILLYKMKKFYGFRGLAFKLLQSCLSNRKHYTKLNSFTFDLSKVKYGVPQGSSLRQLLFLLYINDLVAFVLCIYIMYRLTVGQMTRIKQLLRL